MSSTIEWFLKKFVFEVLRRHLFRNEGKSIEEMENELYDRFVGESFVLTPPQGSHDSDYVNESERSPIIDIEEDIHGRIVSVEVLEVDDGTGAVVDIAFDEELLQYVPREEDRVENSIGFWLQKDDLSVEFSKRTRLGPLISIYTPSIKRNRVNTTIEVIKEIISRVVYLDTGYAKLLYEHLEADMPISSTVIEEIASQSDELSETELKEMIRYLTGSIAGFEPESRLKEE